MPSQDFNSMQQKALKEAMKMKNIASQKSANNQTPFCENACPIKNIISPLSGNVDGDIILLIGLLLLLSADGGDRLLMFALLYIMT